MKKITLLLFTIFAFNLGNAQTNLFFDDFESYTDFIIADIGDWDVLDLDLLGTYTGGGGTYDNQNAAMAFMIFNPSAAGVTNNADPGAGEVRNFDPFSGVKYAAAWASAPAPPVTANDDWFTSPSIDLAASGNSVTFQVKAMSNTYGNEPYEVGVYTGAGTPTGSGDFTIIHSGIATYPDWEEINVALGDYDGQTVRIGIHYTGSDVYMLMVDDFSVDTTLGVDEFDANSFTYSFNKNTDELTLNSAISPLSNIELYNILGQRVHNEQLSQNNEVISMNDLKDGVYLAKISIEDQSKTIKILKQ